MKSHRGRQDEILILDIGRVLMDGTPADLGQDESSVLSIIRSVPLSFRGVAQEVERRFRERVWLVSRCQRERARRNVRAWLEKKGFFDQTGVLRDHVEFCDTNAGKGPIIRRIRGTVVVDDSLEVLLSLPFVPHRILFRPNTEEVTRALRMFKLGTIPSEIVVVLRGWRNVNQTIVDLMGATHARHRQRR